MKNNQIPSSEITPKDMYLSRRSFMSAASAFTAGLALTACGVSTKTGTPVETTEIVQPELEMSEVTSLQDITHYNNYYEFTTDKEGVAGLAKNFATSPWDIEISGLVGKPGKIGVEDLIRNYPPEERVYRLRCVEGWSMVIPWLGFPLSKLLADIEPAADAKYVRFETIYKSEDMPGQRVPSYPWPYQEGLRLDEAMNDLTLLATGLYGGELPAQNGGGIRLVVPWKYGFKSIKAIVKIELTDTQPQTLWNAIAPNEYGFYSNVNPQVDHPRWSQRNERRIGEISRRATLMFNGYSEEVAHLYKDMDLSVYY